MEKQNFIRYQFTDQRTGDIIRYMQINERLDDHNERLKKMLEQIFVETRIPVSAIVYKVSM